MNVHLSLERRGSSPTALAGQMRSIAGRETRGEIVAERALRRAAEPGPHLLRESAALAVGVDTGRGLGNP